MSAANPLPTLHVLYFLEGEDLFLAEVKRTDLINEPDKSKVFFWLLVKKQTETVEKLDFVSMKSEEGKEQRLFLQGDLFFDTQGGSFEDQEGKHRLQTRPPVRLPENTLQEIKKFIQNL